MTIGKDVDPLQYGGAVGPFSSLQGTQPSPHGLEVLAVFVAVTRAEADLTVPINGEVLWLFPQRIDDEGLQFVKFLLQGFDFSLDLQVAVEGFGGADDALHDLGELGTTAGMEHGADEVLP